MIAKLGSAKSSVLYKCTKVSQNVTLGGCLLGQSSGSVDGWRSSRGGWRFYVANKGIKRGDLFFSIILGNLLFFLLDGYEKIFYASPSIRKVGDGSAPSPPSFLYGNPILGSNA